MSGCFRGAGSPGYAGGPTTIRGEFWREIRARVVQEQDGFCGDCGTHVGQSLPVHHKLPFRLFATAEEANVRDNLIGLCSRCHRLADAAVERAIWHAILDHMQSLGGNLIEGAPITV